MHENHERSLRFKNENLFFSETFGSFETKIPMKAYGKVEMKLSTNGLGHMTKVAAMLIYSTLRKSSPEPMNQ